MPSIEDNRRTWDAYGWEQRGDEWSEVWGDTAHLWWGSLYPRLAPFLPGATILEIAPGYGRITQFLQHFCRRLIVVDLTARCIEACRQRFERSPHLEYHVNDGRSLPMVRDGAVDLAFSYDSLVHADADAVHGYVRELARVLAPNGVAFLHHSNVGAFVAGPGEPPSVENSHWRAEDVSADSVAAACAEAGLACVTQEIVNWGGDDLTDCFSLITRPGSRFHRPLRREENPRFMQEALNLGRVARLWGDPAMANEAEAAAATEPWTLQAHCTVRAPGDMLLEVERFSSREEYLRAASVREPAQRELREMEREIAQAPAEVRVRGFCAACDADVELEVSSAFAGEQNGIWMPFFRETLACRRCGLSNRLRATVHLLREVVRPRRNDRVYLTEQHSPVHGWLSQHIQDLETSEFLGDLVPLGARDAAGRRNEDLTCLTYPDQSFDLVVTLEVLEHIDHYRKALAELHRVLVPGGRLLLTTPFRTDLERGVRRARRTPSGEVEHLLEPDYHGDPLREEGCLAFHTFAWDLLDDLRQAGFTDVVAVQLSSGRYGYLGPDSPFVLATRPRTGA